MPSPIPIPSGPLIFKSVGTVIVFPVTVISMLLDIESIVAVIVTVFLVKEVAAPASLALIIPFSSTLATLSSDEDHSILLSLEPTGSRSVIEATAVSPSSRVVFEAVTEKLFNSISSFTVKVNLSLTEALRS